MSARNTRDRNIRRFGLGSCAEVGGANSACRLLLYDRIECLRTVPTATAVANSALTRRAFSEGNRVRGRAKSKTRSLVGAMPSTIFNGFKLTARYRRKAPLKGASPGMRKCCAARRAEQLFVNRRGPINPARGALRAPSCRTDGSLLCFHLPMPADAWHR